MISRFFIDHFRIQGALPVLFDVALKGALLVAVAAVAAYALRKRSAASRHAAWTAAVVGHLAIPALILVLPAWKLPLLPATPWMGTEAPVTSAVVTLEPNHAPATSIPAKSSVASDKNLTPLPTVPPSKSGPTATPSIVMTPVAPSNRPAPIAILAAIWFAGAIFVLLRLAIGTWRVNQLAREGSRVEDGVWLSLTQRLANRLGVTRPLTLLRGERLAVPVTWGIVYPAVLLPEDADEWTEERRRFVLVHEMAHVKRFDALTQLLAQVAVAVFWFDPLVWIAAHQMRVEREHACDDYVLRDGTTPSLYAGELLEMVRSIGTPTHDRAAPAFAALAMARRSEFEGRMLAILDPRLDRHTLQRRGTFMTAVVLAFLVLPLAALRPFEQPEPVTATLEEFPSSFKVSFREATPQSTASAPAPASKPAIAAVPTKSPTQPRYTCEAYPVGTTLTGRSTHISEHTDSDSERLDFLISEPGRCTEAALFGKAVFSADETRIVQLAPDGFMRLRERTASEDRMVTALPAGDGSVSYNATLNGRVVPFDNVMASWVGRMLPEVLREAGVNVPERVARLRAQGGVPAVLEAIAKIHSSGSKRLHYEELIKKGAPLSAADAERIAEQVGRDLTSSGDLSSVIQMLPRAAVQSPGARKAIASALSHIQSSGDKANTLQILAPNADPDLLIILARAAEDLASSGDKANFLIASAAEFLTPNNAALRDAFFHAAATVPSSGDLANVLIDALPYGHADPQVAMLVVETSKGLASSGDAANVLIDLASQRVLAPNNPRAILAAINRTLTMASSGDRANVLISFANVNLLTTPEIRNAFTKAAMALPSDGDRANVLAAAARQ
jgi:beta-lactamase regulating signal transducer with metallopeptidase domain